MLALPGGRSVPLQAQDAAAQGVSATFDDLRIYIVGPIVGAALGALAYQLVRGEHPQPVEDGLGEPGR